MPPIQPPRLSGLPLRMLARAARSQAGRALLQRVLRAELKVDALAALPETARADISFHMRALQARPPRAGHDAKLPLPKPTWGPTLSTLGEAFRSGALTPDALADRVLRGASTLRDRGFPTLLDIDEAAIRRDTAASRERWKAGRPLGPLDGIPIAIKEEIAVSGLPHRYGSDALAGDPAPEDGTSVALLRKSGAIIVGTTPMTEFGMTPSGANGKRALPGNPHKRGHLAGGSSTGSAVAVALGLVPLALGVDGGGSIRIPAAACGIFGIKPTWGRVSRHGSAQGSVAHVGPLAGTTHDLAVSLEAIGRRDPERDEETREAPEGKSLVASLGRGVRGLRIGVPDGAWGEADPKVAKACQDAVAALEREGAVVVGVDFSLARHAAPIGYATIGVEALAALRVEFETKLEAFSEDLQVGLLALAEVKAHEFMDAQRLRSGLRREMVRIFSDVDVLALPTLRTPPSEATEEEIRSGFLDARVIDSFCHFNFLGNLTGLPASSVPVGFTDDGLPIGLQLVGDAWDEATLLATSAHLERVGVAEVRRPEAALSLLG